MPSLGDGSRVRAFLRRRVTGVDGPLRVEDPELDPAAEQVRRAGRAIDLPHTEFALLELVMSDAAEPFLRSLHDAVLLPR